MSTINEKMTALADEIRNKTDRTDTLTIDEMTTAVRGIEVGTDTSDATATEANILLGETAYVNDEKITGTMPNNEAVMPTLHMKATSYTIPEGYHNGSGMVSIVPQVIRVTPTKNEREVEPQKGKVIGKVIVSPISDKYITTTDATATADDILSDKTAYVNGEKIVGTIPTKASQTIVPGTIDKTIAAGQYLAGAQIIKGDPNLLAENIKAGVSIFGIIGTYEGNISNLISFTIDGETYQAEDGMTWGEWVGSEYNPGIYSIYSDNSIQHQDGINFVATYEESWDGWNTVYATHSINPDNIYGLQSDSWGD